jgi:hypothetical protein
MLYLMAVDQRSDGDAAKVVEILEEWLSWAQNANLRRAGVEADEKTNDPARPLLKEKRRQGDGRERSEVKIHLIVLSLDCYGSVKMIRFSYSNKDIKNEEGRS